jgi:hypothetical protein
MAATPCGSRGALRCGEGPVVIVSSRLLVVFCWSRSQVSARLHRHRPQPLILRTALWPLSGNGDHTVDLSVPVGTPLQVVLDREVRVKKAGQPLHARLVQPVYAFDQLVLPAGTKVDGHIARIGRPSGKQLTFSILNADFSPPRPVEVITCKAVISHSPMWHG